MPTVIVLLSDKRSGSTMLQEELCRHPSVRRVDHSPHTYFETHHWLEAAVILRQPATLFSGGQVYAGYGSRANARAYMVETLTRNVPDYVVPDDDAALVFEGWEALCRTFASPVFFEKSPQVLAHWAALDLLLDWIGHTEMEVRVIGLVRNPLAVQYSAQELFSTKAELRQFGWLDIQRNLLTMQSLLPPEYFRLVRYEDLISEPADQLARICDFVGLSQDARLGASVHVQSREKWRADPAYMLQLDPAVARLARHFGYAKQELDNPNATMKPSGSARVVRGGRLRRWVKRQRDSIVHPMIIRWRNRVRSGR